MIELYIDNRLIELDKEIDIKFNYSSVDAQQPTAIKNSFSKTVAIPGTPNNNDTFGNIWRLDNYITTLNPDLYTGIYYDPHKRTPFSITQNGALIETGYAVLDNITVVDNIKTYNVTLYGGIGEFFFNLMYTDEGVEKNLADMYWRWQRVDGYPATLTQLTKEQEDTEVVYRWNALTVANAFHLFNPNNSNDGFTRIDRDILAVPCYSGQHEDFQSNTMIVDDFNTRYLTTPYAMPETLKQKWTYTLPIQYLDEADTSTDPPSGTIYSQWYNNYNYYGVMTYPRDLDPMEARDLRVNYLPVALRLSKFLTVLSNPANNGGYNVEWDSSITDSYYWKYGFLYLGMPKYEEIVEGDYEIEPTDSDGYALQIVNTNNVINMDVSGDTTIATLLPSGSTVSTVGMINPKLNLKILPKISTRASVQPDDTVTDNTFAEDPLDSNRCLFNSKAIGYIVNIKDGNSIVKQVLSLVHMSNTGTGFGTNFSVGSHTTSSKSTMKQTILNKINSTYSTFFNDYTLYDYVNITDIGGEPGVVWPYIWVAAHPITLTVSLPATISNLTVELKEFRVNYLYYEKTGTSGEACFLSGDMASAKTWVTTNVTNGMSNQNYIDKYIRTALVALGRKAKSSSGDYYTYGLPTLPWYYLFNTSITTGSNIVHNTTNNMKNYVNLYKYSFLGGTKSPFKYLVDFMKLLNLRCTYDKTRKLVNIVPMKKWYIDETIDLSNDIDYSREMKINPIFYNAKFLRASLNTLDCYPLSIYNRIIKNKYDEVVKDTGIMYNLDSTELFKDMSLENVLSWQQQSIYYNDTPFLPPAFNQNVIDWKLFNISQADGVKELSHNNPTKVEDIITTTDPVPKIGVFDKDNKHVAAKNSFIFLSGFYRNFDYVLTNKQQHWVVAPRVMFTNNTTLEKMITGEYCYKYDYHLNGTFTTWGYYHDSATAFALPWFSRDLEVQYMQDFEGFELSTTLLASWNLEKPEYDLTDETNMQLCYDTNRFIKGEAAQYEDGKLLPGPNENLSYDYYHCSKDDNKYIWNAFWKDYIDDLYDRNSKEVTLYARITGDPNIAIKKFYSFEGCLWTIVKIEDYKMSSFGDQFSKVTFHKVIDKNNYVD